MDEKIEYLKKIQHYRDMGYDINQLTFDSPIEEIRLEIMRIERDICRKDIEKMIQIGMECVTIIGNIYVGKKI
jgi:hypothetical protein